MSDIPVPAPQPESIRERPSVNAPILFGIALSALIAAAAFALRAIPGVSVFSPMILAIVLGMAFHNVVGTPAAAKAGVAFAMRRILRFAIMLLGFQLTAQQIADVGFAGVAVIAASLIASFLFAIWAGRILGVEEKLTQLIAAGTSICGASAVIATNTVSQASDEDVAYAVVCVTMFGTIAMFVYPFLPDVLHLAPRAYGLWAGASIHEVAQVVAAAYQEGKSAGDYGTITKLTRVIMLAPTVMALGALAARKGKENASAPKPAPMPTFIAGFVAAMAVNSVFAIPPMPKGVIVMTTTFLLSLALAALGLETDIGKLRAKGTRPLMLCGAATIFIAVLSLMLVKAAG
jgi:uncharacterized integral membrane protein (TIGR00698 family)